MVNPMDRNHKRAMSYTKEGIDWKLRQNDERSVHTEMDRPYLVLDGIIIEIDEVERVVDVSAQSS